MKVRRILVVPALALALGACDRDGDRDGARGDGDGDGKADDPSGCFLDVAGVCREGGDDQAAADPSCCRQDILSTDLSFAFDAHTAIATVTLAESDDRSVVLEVGDLTVQSVEVDGSAAEFQVADKKLVVSRAGEETGDRDDQGDDGEDEVSLSIRYGYQGKAADQFEGFMDAPLTDMTFTWPEFCGNLFPCQSHPRDGLTFTIEVTGVPEGQTLVAPAEVPAEAPSYQAAFSVGNYQKRELGTTTAGTEVAVWFLEGGEEAALAGAKDLVQVFDFYEQTYGPYSFGGEVGSVSVDWGDGDFGGMEHHPFWHVSRGSMGNALVHHHEAAHGWFGDGVRLQCREDFVLSEGVVSYLEARSTEAVGAMTEEAIWTQVQSKYEQALASRDFVIYPDGCDQVATLFDLFTNLPYKKGALFMRQVEKRVGRASLDAAIASFYQERVGTAATMQEFVDHIARETGSDIDDLVQGWLKSTGTPCTLARGDCTD